jgi:hypothetical protein
MNFSDSGFVLREPLADFFRVAIFANPFAVGIGNIT